MTTIKVKAPTFEPFGQELNAEVAFWQAANALDLAVYLAVQSGNIDKLLDASATWVGIGERLARGLEVEEDEDIPDNPNKPPFGFCNPPSDKEPVEKTPDIIVEAENDEEENNEDA